MNQVKVHTLPFKELADHTQLRLTELSRVCNKTPLTISRWLEGGIPEGVSAPTAMVVEYVCARMLLALKNDWLPCANELKGKERKMFIDDVFTRPLEDL